MNITVLDTQTGSYEKKDYHTGNSADETGRTPHYRVDRV
jgi:hypothetical protein